MTSELTETIVRSEHTAERLRRNIKDGTVGSDIAAELAIAQLEILCRAVQNWKIIGGPHACHSCDCNCQEESRNKMPELLPGDCQQNVS